MPPLDDDFDEDDGHKVIEDDLFDYYQDVARSSFDDMLHDDERNQLFFQAIQKSIKKLRQTMNEKIFVLDIGTGTGLLSMMSIISGADKVIACEQSMPMVSCAKNIINLNGMADRIQIFPKHSTSLTLDDQDVPNLLVAELLDTELIGEGCLYAYSDAIKRLVKPNTMFVPAKGRIWIQLVQSDYLFRNHQFRKSFRISENIVIETPDKILNCFGSHLLHDIQMNQLRPERDFEILSDPVKVFEFQFNKLQTLKLRDHKRVLLHLKRKFDKPMMILSWWEIDMDSDGEIKLSCSPYWARENLDAERLAWREHWMQTIYYLPAFAFDLENQVTGFKFDYLNAKNTVMIDAFHDGFSFWFDLPNQEESALENNLINNDCWFCHCSFHSNLSRAKIQWINDIDRYLSYWNSFDYVVKKNNFKNIELIVLSTESLIALVLASHSQVHKINLVHVDSVHRIPSSTIDGFVYDYNFSDSIKERFKFLKLITKFANNPNIKFTIPSRTSLRCLPIRLKHLWKCFAPIEKIQLVETIIDLKPYDDLIIEARKYADEPFEIKYLWEYRSWPLIDSSLILFEFDHSNHRSMDDLKRLEKSISLDLSHLDGQNLDPKTFAFVCWTEHTLPPDHFISNGLKSSRSIVLEEELEWVRDQPQLINSWAFYSDLCDNFNVKASKIDVKFELNFVKDSLKILNTRN
ncbi:Protein arginine N-methyltransferase 7 [Sarcoptes scabiei]|uniref:Protein arginine N-methyltransferase n=1 Tax=Sarcoptes scabiei TaxID=52283 RepID=A0A834RF02_SARSC|nr:Protein arginine N-methyltransferase 7 [Sarcoptes scabiei]